MNNLFRHIEYLLLRHDCVIVPGLGAFISASRPAKIDMQEGKILPPSKSLMFNQSVATDDGLLANSFARKTGMKFEEARQAVVHEVNDIKVCLRDNGMVECGGLGKLVTGEEGNIVFLPSKSPEIKSEHMGFLKTDMSLFSQKDEAPQIPQEKPSQPDNCTQATQDTEKNYYQLRISKAFIRVASVMAVVAAVALTVILNPIPHDNREQRASVVPVEVLIAKPKPEHKIINTVPQEQSIVQPVEQKQPAHYLIVATFSSEKEAHSYADRFSTPEFPMTTVASRKVCRVAITSSDDRDSLRRQLNSSPVASRYPGAWIWSR